MDEDTEENEIEMNEEAKLNEESPEVVESDSDTEKIVLKKTKLSVVRPTRRTLLAQQLAGISQKAVSKKDVNVGAATKTRKFSFDENEFGQLPPADYYFSGGGLKEPEDPENSYTPVGRNAVECGSRFYVERNLFSYLTNTKIPMEKNYYDDDQVELSCLLKEPIGYIILGKPGIGKTTLAKRLATKLKTVYISPEEVIEHYKSQDVIKGIKVNELLESGQSIGDKIVVELIKSRIAELDVLHRGYVMDGFPMTLSEGLSIEEQIAFLDHLAIIPRYAFILNMQDADLYKRRIDQKFDPQTSIIYPQVHYGNFNPDMNVFPNITPQEKNSFGETIPRPPRSNASSADAAFNKEFSEMRSSVGSQDPRGKMNSKNYVLNDGLEDDDPLDGSRDFPSLGPEVLFRLLSRTEDRPIFVNDDLEQFRKILPALQDYVGKFDKRNVLELDAYWAPSVIFKRVFEFLEASGQTAVPIPQQIFQTADAPKFRDEFGEFLGEDDDSEAPCPEEEAAAEIDWESAIKAVCIRGLVDPRFRWRVSRWYNICPVALKNGRSILGKPELATSFLDKVYFMANAEAVEKFTVNPRPFLLPRMPTSPIRFFVIGHPLAGKTAFASALATLTDSIVVDMNDEMEKRYEQVKQDYLYKKRLMHALEAKILVDKENHKEWKRQEKARRAAMHKWVDDYIRGLAEAEIRAALDADRERRRAERIALRKDAEYHKLQLPPYGDAGMCQGDDGWTKFCWSDFVKQIHEGKTNWTHQEWLQLAWDLFHVRRLYYKLPKRKLGDEDGLGAGEVLGEDDGGILIERLGESGDESEAEEEMPKKIRKRKKRRRCKRVLIQPEPDHKNELIYEVEEQAESSDIDPNDNEIEESIRMRYPLIPPALVELIPQPSPAPESHPRVMDIVTSKLKDDEIYVDGYPAELYIEVMKRGCSHAESIYHQTHTDGPLTGGWIVENIVTDIDKFRAILRTSEVCPDQIFLLADRSENHTEIYGRLKNIFRNKIKAEDRKSSRKSSARLKKSLLRELEGEIVGEGGFYPGPEDQEFELELDEDDEIADLRSYFQTLLPLDDLTQPLTDTPSNILQLLIDANRARTPLDPDEANREDFWENLLTQHERFVLEQIRSKLLSGTEPPTADGCLANDEIRRQFAAYKSLNYEMSAYVKSDKKSEPSSKPSLVDQIKEEVAIITEFLRQSKEEIENLASSEHGPNPSMDTEGQEQLNEEQLIDDEDDEEEAAIEQKKADEAAGEGGEKEDGEEENDDTRTPEGLRSAVDLDDDGDNDQTQVIACPEDMGDEEKVKCLEEQDKQKQETKKAESPKRRFFIQIRIFEEFLNMAILSLNQQGIKFWEVGLIDESNAAQKASHFWNLLESRFEIKAKRISETELREEDEEIQESLMKWGQPYEHNNPTGRVSGDTQIIRRKSIRISIGDADGFDEMYGEVEDNDLLSTLVGKPDLYLRTLKKIETHRCFGDMKSFCPVTFAEFNLLKKGSQEFACKYKDRLYYCASEERAAKFVENPKAYLPDNQPKTPPPPRICVTGSPGCGQEEVALKIAKEYNICYVNFRQRLHELMKARFGKDIGPNKTGTIVESYNSLKRIARAKSGDDMLGTNNSSDNTNKEEADESEYDEDGDEDEGEEILYKPKSKLTIHPILLETKSEEFTIQEAALRSLGLLEQPADLKTVPIGNVERAERLTRRNWKMLTQIESYIQAFIENGIQLPDIVLDEFVAPLWKESPFNQVGFVLVGFPNTEDDVHYLVKKKFLPEMVYVMECQALAIRNRLLIEAVDRWHKENNPSGKRKRKLSEIRGLSSKVINSGQRMTDRSKNGPYLMGFAYQTEGRPVIDEYERETWGYNDGISARITRALKHFHNIYSKDIRNMKISLNKNRLDWLPIKANANLFEAKQILYDTIMPRLKHRESVFEDTVVLTLKEANALLNRGIFVTSKYQRRCPTEIEKGNTAVNLWNTSSVNKIPILHRRYIYFLAGEKNANHFQSSCWSLVNQDAPTATVPAVVVVLGPPKSGKTTLARKISNRLGFVYISGPEMIDSVLRHSFVTQFADILNQLDPSTLTGGPQQMLLADEILNYTRNGHTVPKFLVYRALDLILQSPKAQYHGVVFDDYPVTEEELQELLYRGVVPSIVIQLNIELEEAFARCQRNRKPDYNFVDLPEEGNEAVMFSTQRYHQAVETTLFWFKNEVQNVFEFDGTKNAEWIYQQSAERIKENMKKMQNYLTNVLQEKASTLEGTCPLTSQIPLRLSPEFGCYCPVALNERDDLVRVTDVSDLSEVVEYKGYVYLFANSQNAKRFLANPKKYTPPHCAKQLPPKDQLPQACQLSQKQFEQLEAHWGFLDFDPVRYYDSNQHYKGLERGLAKYTVLYKNKIFCFISEENMKKFMKKPEKYQIPLPQKIPPKNEPMDMDKVTPYVYLIETGILNEIRKVIQLTGERRPRVPFMNADRAVQIYMGHYFKSQNMNSPYEVRQKYRNAMFDMMQLKDNTKKFLTELEDYYGSRLKNLPDRIKTKLEDFLKLESMPDNEKVLNPAIPGVVLTGTGVQVAEDYDVIRNRFKTLKQLVHEMDVKETIGKLAEQEAEEAEIHKEQTLTFSTNTTKDL